MDEKVMEEVLVKMIPKELITLNVRLFFLECVNMIQLYAKKNHDYGNSFEQGMNVIGFAYGMGRLYDKMNRMLRLSKVKAQVTDEAMEDTVRDLACYAVMTSVHFELTKCMPVDDESYKL